MIDSRRDSHFGLRRETALACAFTDDDASGDWDRDRDFGQEGCAEVAEDDLPQRMYV
jgi:hypothetical protein